MTINTTIVTVETIRALANNDGLTLKAFHSISYNTGWQVADYGVECQTAEEAMVAVNAMCGNAGIWFSDGIYYVDHSFRIKTKHHALAIGRQHNQISIYGWESGALAYC